MSTEKYANLSRAELEDRLRLAEDVCALVAWSPVQHGERGDALTQVWQRWAEVGPSDRADYPHLDDAGIAALAAERCAARARAFARLHTEAAS